MPGNLTTVTIGTDGLRDYVQLPDGTRHNLGVVSVLNFVTSLVPSHPAARQALDRFNAEGETMVAVDLDTMALLFTPHRARWSSASFLIPTQNRNPTKMGKDNGLMADENFKVAFAQKLRLVDEHVQQIGKLADAGFPQAAIRSGALHLKELVASIHLTDFGNQSKNNAFYGLGAPKVDTAEPGQALPKEVTHPKVAADETLRENTAVAEGVLHQVAETETKINQLVAAGRKFNAAQAKRDLHEVSLKLSALLEDADLTQPVVKNELAPIAQRAGEIHALFFAGSSKEGGVKRDGKVVESKMWKHKNTGVTASLFGAVPWSGQPGDEKKDWSLENVGWTIQWDDGTTGIGRKPFQTKAEAEEYLSEWKEKRQKIIDRNKQGGVGS